MGSGMPFLERMSLSLLSLLGVIVQIRSESTLDKPEKYVWDWDFWFQNFFVGAEIDQGFSV
jgi:hypothetical protein